MGSAMGAMKVAAARVGLTPEQYQAKLDEGMKWCTGCKDWHGRDAFDPDGSRTDGLSARCRSARRTLYRDTYVSRPRPAPGRRYAPARHGDKLQARGRVNYLVRLGAIPDPNDVACVDCGHIWSTGESGHEYDHFLGYEAQNHESVEAVCRPCHVSREKLRRRQKRNGSTACEPSTAAEVAR